MEEKHRNIKEFGEGQKDGLEPLKPLELGDCKTVDDIVRGMKFTAFGGRNLGEAADVLESMTKDRKCLKVLTLSGAMTIAKMSHVVCDMIENGMADIVVSTGALMAHGFTEAAGMTHFKYRPDMNDEELYDKGYNRVYDTLEMEKNLDAAAEIVSHVLDEWDGKEPLCSYKLNEKLGEFLVKNAPGRGVLKSAYVKKVPVYVPAFTDSELGLDLGTNKRKRKLDGRPDITFDPYLDLEDYTERVRKADKLGIFTIGGGVPRNWAQQVGPYLDLIDRRIGEGGAMKMFQYATRICPEPVHWGGLCLHGDTKIDSPRDLTEYPDGVPIRELADTSNFPVYAYDFHKKRIVLSNARRVWKTGVKKLYKVKYGWIAGWSNGRKLRTEEIVASAEHKIMLRDGNFKLVSELKENDRLMPFNTYHKADKHGFYRFISLNNGKKIPEHRFIVQEMIGRKLAMSEAVHHIDHNTLNNTPDNLDTIDFVDHARYHRFAQTQESIEKQRQTLKEITNPLVMQEKSRKFWNDLDEEEYQRLCEKRKQTALQPEERIRRSAISTSYWLPMNKEEKKIRLQNAHEATRKRWGSLSPETRSRLVTGEKNGRFIKGITDTAIRNALIAEEGVITRAARKLNISTKVFQKRMQIHGIGRKWIEENCVDNHFVMSVEYFGEDETYDMTVDNTHNFAANGIIVSNSGCTYSEGVSWGKFVPRSQGGMQAEVFADATIAWPIIIKAVMERLRK
ncbi:MAG: deoxyhypusine synthase family protein [Candidatus Micrarchaeota archaeon]